MKNWRPKDWKNPYYKTEEALGAKVFWNQYPEFGIFEAGADAMLEAIRSLPLPSDITDAIMGMRESPQKTDWVRPNGQVIFIPEEVKEC